MKNQNIGFTRSARLFRLVPALAVTALIAVIMQVTGPSAPIANFSRCTGSFRLALKSGYRADRSALTPQQFTVLASFRVTHSQILRST